MKYARYLGLVLALVFAASAVTAQQADSPPDQHEPQVQSDLVHTPLFRQVTWSAMGDNCAPSRYVLVEREYLERLEAIDDRLKRLEQTAYWRDRPGIDPTATPADKGDHDHASTEDFGTSTNTTVSAPNWTAVSYHARE